MEIPGRSHKVEACVRGDSLVKSTVAVQMSLLQGLMKGFRLFQKGMNPIFLLLLLVWNESPSLRGFLARGIGCRGCLATGLRPG